MSFFFGLFPDQKTVHRIKKVVGEVGMTFDGFDIPVRWSDPNKYHLTILHLGENLNILKRFLIRYKVKKFAFQPFSVRLGNIKLGISRKYKELVYLDVAQGGEDLRKLYLELKKICKTKNNDNFIPHITLGRVSKDLTDQEHFNLCRDLGYITEKLEISDIKFDVQEVRLVKSKEGKYQVLMKLEDSSKISS